MLPGAPQARSYLAPASHQPFPLPFNATPPQTLRRRQKYLKRKWLVVCFAPASFIQVSFHTPFNREYSTALVSSLWRPEALRRNRARGNAGVRKHLHTTHRLLTFVRTPASVWWCLLGGFVRVCSFEMVCAARKLISMCLSHPPDTRTRPFVKQTDAPFSVLNSLVCLQSHREALLCLNQTFSNLWLTSLILPKHLCDSDQMVYQTYKGILC